MMGTEDDWKRLIDKLETVEDLLKPIDQVLQMAEWFTSSKVVLKNLLETYRGNPDKEWWSRIMDIFRFGSGGGTKLTGWFVRDFLGIKFGYMKDVPSGVNVVPLTIVAGITRGICETCYTEEAALVAGVTGFKITEGEVTEDNVTFPSVQSVPGWGLLMYANSSFN